MNPLLRIVLGPTASGKERIACACAEQLGGEIVSVDSMKIYRTLDVGTAKASPELRARIPHHGLDLIDPDASFSVAQYVETAERAIAEIVARGRMPILSGGTALYYKGLLEGLFDGPPADPELRESLKREAEDLGADALHARLHALDPQAAAKIHPNDTRRVVRAIEVVTLTGKPISSQQTQWGGFHAEGKAEYRYPVAICAIDRPREELYARIEERVDRMMEQGLLDEARLVYDNRERFAHTPLQAVGYKEFFAYFDGVMPLAEAVELLKKNTRHLAKSQMTWFRKFPCTWIPAGETETPETVAARVMAAWDQ